MTSLYFFPVEWPIYVKWYQGSLYCYFISADPKSTTSSYGLEGQYFFDLLLLLRSSFHFPTAALQKHCVEHHKPHKLKENESLQLAWHHSTWTNCAAMGRSLSFEHFYHPIFLLINDSLHPRCKPPFAVGNQNRRNNLAIQGLSRSVGLINWIIRQRELSACIGHTWAQFLCFSA